MTQIGHPDIAALHTRAAYAHTAAAYGHSTGDHASTLDLARNAHERSAEAVKYAEEVVKEVPLQAKSEDARSKFGAAQSSGTMPIDGIVFRL